jgi:hypothetical protein
MTELGIPIPQRRKLREKLLTAKVDWFKHGTSIIIRRSGETKLRVWKEEPRLVAEVAEYRVCQIPPNPTCVMIDVGGVAKVCVIPKNIKSYMRKGLTIKAARIEDKNGVTYRHESIN